MGLRQRFISPHVLPRLDGRHVVFGHVLEGLDVVKKIEVRKGRVVRASCFY